MVDDTSGEATADAAGGSQRSAAERRAVHGAQGRSSSGSGRWLVRLDVAATVLFAAAIGVAAPLRDERPAQVMVVVVSIVLFAVGVVLSLWAYASALERSRLDEIGVANLYLLTGGTAPSAVRLPLTLALVGQAVVALTGAVVGLRGLEGNDLNALAFGVLVPMLGIGVNGSWAVRHGSFGPRLTGGSATNGRGIG